MNIEQCVAEYDGMIGQSFDRSYRIKCLQDIITELNNSQLFVAERKVDEILNGTHDWKTTGNYETEESSQSAFMYYANRLSSFFKIYREVDLWYYGGQPFQSRAFGRIDFVLLPTATAISAGWDAGIIGVECKKSNHKAGPLLMQMLDYSRSIAKLPNNYNVVLNAVYMWPTINYGHSGTGTIESFMFNNRLGCVRIENDKWYTRDDGSYEPAERISFYCGKNQGMWYLTKDGQAHIHKFNQIDTGKKSGSR